MKVTQHSEDNQLKNKVDSVYDVYGESFEDELKQDDEVKYIPEVNLKNKFKKYSKVRKNINVFYI